MSKWLRRLVLGSAGLVVLTVGVLIILVTVTKLPGEEETPAGVRRNTAIYISMKDGVRIAADVWLPQDYKVGQRFPVLMQQHATDGMANLAGRSGCWWG
jgi:predicted acyl esterase